MIVVNFLSSIPRNTDSFDCLPRYYTDLEPLVKENWAR
jgi:hypothetical protein